MRKVFFFLSLTFILLSFSSSLKKKYVPYPAICSKANLIVEGRITSYNEKEYEFEINEFLKGNDANKITVEFFEEWTCDQRVLKPEKNQHILLFLTKSDSGKYEIINGSTGEIFIINGTDMKSMSDGAFFSFSLYNYYEFKEAVKMLSESYKYVGDLYPNFGDKTYYRQIVDDKTIKKYQSNRLFKLLSPTVEK